MIRALGMLGKWLEGRLERRMWKEPLIRGWAPWPAAVMPAISPFSWVPGFVLQAWARRVGRQCRGGPWGLARAWDCVAGCGIRTCQGQLVKAGFRTTCKIDPGSAVVSIISWL